MGHHRRRGGGSVRRDRSEMLAKRGPLPEPRSTGNRASVERTAILLRKTRKTRWRGCFVRIQQRSNRNTSRCRNIHLEVKKDTKKLAVAAGYLLVYGPTRKSLPFSASCRAKFETSSTVSLFPRIRTSRFTSSTGAHTTLQYASHPNMVLANPKGFMTLHGT